MAFSSTLRQLLNERKMKAVELSRQTGISEGVISEYLSGKKEPRGKQSIAVAKALNVSLDVLWETGFDSTKNQAPLQNLSREASEKLEKLLSLVDQMTDDEWNQFMEYGNLLLRAQRAPKDD